MSDGIARMSNHRYEDLRVERAHHGHLARLSHHDLLKGRHAAEPSRNVFNAARRPRIASGRVHLSYARSLPPDRIVGHARPRFGGDRLRCSPAPLSPTKVDKKVDPRRARWRLLDHL